MSERPCQCGAKMVEVIGYKERPELYPYRAGWYCANCHYWIKAIFRERVVDAN